VIRARPGDSGVDVTSGELASGAEDDGAAHGSRARSRYGVMSDRALCAALRSRDGEAVEEFIRRYQALILVQARRLRIPPDERTQWTIELLYHVASAIASDRAAIPRAIGPYLVTACRRKAHSEWRGRASRERWEMQCADETGALDQRAVVSVCSEASVRSTYGPDWEPVALPAVLERLVSVFEEGISPDERQLLSWIGQRTSYTTVAEWLGISRPAAVKRVTRLRNRLIEAALRFGASLDPADLADLARFLRRTGVVDEATLARMNDRNHTMRGRR
jgi:hypothetical protein